MQKHRLLMSFKNSETSETITHPFTPSAITSEINLSRWCQITLLLIYIHLLQEEMPVVESFTVRGEELSLSKNLSNCFHVELRTDLQVDGCSVCWNCVVVQEAWEWPSDFQTSVSGSWHKVVQPLRCQRESLWWQFGWAQSWELGPPWNPGKSASGKGILIALFSKVA